MIMDTKKEAGFMLLQEILKETSPEEVEMVTPAMLDAPRAPTLAEQPLGFGIEILGPWVAGAVCSVLKKIGNEGLKKMGEKLGELLGQTVWDKAAGASAAAPVKLDAAAMEELLGHFTYEYAEVGLSPEQCSRLANATTMVILRNPEIFRRLVHAS